MFRFYSSRAACSLARSHSISRSISTIFAFGLFIFCYLLAGFSACPRGRLLERYTSALSSALSCALTSVICSAIFLIFCLHVRSSLSAWKSPYFSDRRSPFSLSSFTPRLSAQSSACLFHSLLVCPVVYQLVSFPACVVGCFHACLFVCLNYRIPACLVGRLPARLVGRRSERIESDQSGRCNFPFNERFDMKERRGAKRI